jgi:RimJ/RimL family protein N-acetyltransferase
MPSMIKNWLRRRLGVDDGDSDDDLEEADRERGQLVRKGRLVALRTHVGANRDAFQRWYGDPEIAELLRHDLEPLNEHQSRNYFDTFILPASARGFCFAIHERRGKRLIGTTALTDRTTGKAGVSALFRIVIGEKDAWGKGFGTEATRLVMEEAFESLGLDEVRLEVFGHNTRALATYQRVGFEIVGEHVEWVPRQKVELRVVEMRLTRPAFAATAEQWGQSKRGSASRSGTKDREERAARRAKREARRANLQLSETSSTGEPMPEAPTASD